MGARSLVSVARDVLSSTVSLCHDACYFVYTMWLFIVNDMLTMVIPNFTFAFLLTQYAPARSFEPSLLASARAMTWIILQLLWFCVGNQNRTLAIQEDQVNKAWRPVPSGRISQQGAQRLEVVVGCVALVTSLLMGGGIIESFLGLIMTNMYNTGRLGDRHWFWKNGLNSTGMATFAAGGTSAALQAPLSRDDLAKVGIIAAVILTTIHGQDMHDQEGDRASGRHTIPLVYGDVPARWSLFVGIITWSIALGFRASDHPAYALAIVLSGLVVASRYLVFRTVKTDVLTFKFYCVWLVSIYVFLACN